MDAGQQLGDLTPKAIRKLEEILDFPLDRADPDFLKLMSAQKDACSTILGTVTKVGELRIQKESSTQLNTLLALIHQRETENSLTQ